MIDTRAADRFWAKVRPAGWDDCWEWTATRSVEGYGRFTDSARRVSAFNAHRWAYEHLRGEIPDGLQLDHLCRNRGCVNPWHCEPVTGRINVLRGESFAAINATKTHCHRGHEFTPENTYLTRGKRQCRSCCRLADQRYYQRHFARAS
jgi:hypothetical protein